MHSMPSCSMHVCSEQGTLREARAPRSHTLSQHGGGSARLRVRVDRRPSRWRGLFSRPRRCAPAAFARPRWLLRRCTAQRRWRHGGPHRSLRDHWVGDVRFCGAVPLLARGGVLLKCSRDSAVAVACCAVSKRALLL